jgi:hypothetical protein
MASSAAAAAAAPATTAGDPPPPPHKIHELYHGVVDPIHLSHYYVVGEAKPQLVTGTSLYQFGCLTSGKGGTQEAKYLVPYTRPDPQTSGNCFCIICEASPVAKERGTSMSTNAYNFVKHLWVKHPSFLSPGDHLLRNLARIKEEETKAKAKPSGDAEAAAPDAIVTIDDATAGGKRPRAQQGIASMFASSEAAALGARTADTLALAVAAGNLPLSIVDNPGLLLLLDVVSKGSIVVPSRKTVTVAVTRVAQSFCHCHRRLAA